MKSLELSEIKFQIDEYKFVFDFYIVDALEEGIILGIDFLKRYKFKIDVENVELTCNGNGVKSMRIRVKEPILVST